MLSEQVRLAGGCGVVVHKQIIALLWPRFQRHQQKCPPARTATAWRPVGRTRSLLWGRLWAGAALGPFRSSQPGPDYWAGGRS